MEQQRPGHDRTRVVEVSLQRTSERRKLLLGEKPLLDDLAADRLGDAGTGPGSNGIGGPPSAAPASRHRSPGTILRHQFVSLLICAGKHPKYIAQQAGYSSAGFTLDRYGTLFETLSITAVEWWDELLWPSGHHLGTVVDASGQGKAGEQGFERTPQPKVPGGLQE